MKAIVLEIVDMRVRILTETGDFLSCDENRLGDVTCGQQIEYEKEKRIGMSETFRFLLQPRYGAVVVAMLLLILLLPIGLLNQKPAITGYVTFDINPSVQVSYGKGYNVLDIIGLDTEGQMLIDGIGDLSGPVVTVIGQLVEEASALGYMDSDKNGILISVVAEEDDEILVAQLEDYLTNEVVLKSAVIYGELSDMDAAESKGISVGLFLSKEEAIEQNVISSFEEEISTLQLVEVMLEEEDSSTGNEEESNEDNVIEESKEESDEEEDAEESEEPEESDEDEDLEESKEESDEDEDIEESEEESDEGEDLEESEEESDEDEDLEESKEESDEDEDSEESEEESDEDEDPEESEEESD